MYAAVLVNEICFHIFFIRILQNLRCSLVKSYTVKKGYRLSSAGKSLSFFTVYLPMMAFLSRAYCTLLVKVSGGGGGGGGGGVLKKRRPPIKKQVKNKL